MDQEKDIGRVGVAVPDEGRRFGLMNCSSKDPATQRSFGCVLFDLGIDPDTPPSMRCLKSRLAEMAKHERRSLSKQVELLLEGCIELEGRKGITMPSKGSRRGEN